ncbi:FAD-dependent oxidoreductase [Phytoactinopolyspora alkaliphila]|uniref:FAD-dependent oxidoreductase n=1 Tax=Phytoactinopolyspora alkaliphila TaxID=1783498 RepID=A0A6N9YIC9_9ACTN|nr:FAD-dependent oxidoreductase [Phytoactinopolyspora alkaliphila]NED94658.1 FAD-dependent oxidoreductase [Phytoactinopolyspora alkaliphila]
MSKPAILTVDDDREVSAAITRDLRSRYGAAYRILQARSGADALALLTALALRNQPVALIAADQRMPEMTGIEMLEQARTQTPDAKYLLLTAYADTDAAIKAINDIGLDYYLLKPWDPPEERLYPVVDDLLGDWRDAHPDYTSGLRVVGHKWSDRSHEIKTFLARNHVPYRWYDIERDAEAQRLSQLAQATAADLPLVLVPDGEALRSPSSLDVADALGLRTRAEQPLYDVCIVGGGPAGLAAAVYAASEGLSTVVVEREAPGGQASQSAAIENYLGFPRGLAGSDLTHRAVAQVSRFGAEMVLARDVIGFQTRGPVHAVLLEGSAEIEARALIVATGVSYRRLAAAGLDELIGRGVYYGASASEASQCQGDDVYIVGAANSAGQAALNMAKFAKCVVLVVRAATLEDTMSQYLVDRIKSAPNIDVRYRSEVVECRGDGHLEALTLADRITGVRDEVSASWLFVFIGASPRTDWLGPDVVRDDKGFVVTGQDLHNPAFAQRWPLHRVPFALETSVPGVFAAGDVRLDSMKRVASAVGEGAMSVYLVHRYLASI